MCVQHLPVSDADLYPEGSRSLRVRSTAPCCGCGYLSCSHSSRSLSLCVPLLGDPRAVLTSRGAQMAGGMYEQPAYDLQELKLFRLKDPQVRERTHLL